MKNLVAAFAILALSGPVTAGSLVYAPEVENIVVDEEPMRPGSGSWIVPLILIGLLTVVISGADDEPPLNNGANNPTNGVFNNPTNGVSNSPNP